MAVLILDTFTRTVANSWGTAETGGVYDEPGPTARGVSGGLGTIAVSGVTAGAPAAVLAVSAIGSVLVVHWSIDQMPVGGNINFRPVVRWIDTDQHYYFELRLRPANAIQQRIVRRSIETGVPVNNQLLLVNHTLTVVAGVVYSQKVEILGANPTTLRMKFWRRDLDTEPVAWGLSTTDSLAALQAAGQHGLRVSSDSTVTNVVTFRVDSWQVDGTAAVNTALNGSTAGTGTATGVLTTGNPLIGTSAGHSSATAVLGSSGPTIWLRDTFTRVIDPPDPPPPGGFGVAAAPPESTYYDGNPIVVVLDGDDWFATNSGSLTMDGTSTVKGQSIPWSNPNIQKIVRNVNFRNAAPSGIVTKGARNVIIYGCSFFNLRRNVANLPTGSGFPGHGIAANGGTAAIPTDNIVVAKCTFDHLGVDGIQWGGASSPWNGRWVVEYNDFYGPGSARAAQDPDGSLLIRWGENAMDVKGTKGPFMIRGNLIRGFRPCMGPSANPSGGQDCSGDPGAGATIHDVPDYAGEGFESGFPRDITVIGNWFDDNGYGVNSSLIDAGLKVSGCRGYIDVGTNKWTLNRRDHLWIAANAKVLNARVASAQDRDGGATWSPGNATIY